QVNLPPHLICPRRSRRKRVHFSGRIVPRQCEANVCPDASPCNTLVTLPKVMAQKLPNISNRRLAADKEESTMKKLTALTAGWLLIAGLTFADQPNKADQKWLEVVQKKVVQGQ